MTDKINNYINTATRAVELKTQSQTYQAGVCNIGNSEREKRRTLAIFGGMFAFAWPFLGFVFVFPMLVQILVFFPTFIGVLNLLQYRQQFCAYYGLTNQYKFTETGNPLKVIDQRDKSLDQDKSINIIAISLGVSFAYTILTVVLF